MRLAAIVLNFGTPNDSWLAVRSLARSRRPPDELIVVDNDEAPGCEARMAACGHPVRYHRTGRNLGFAGGMNVGITMARERGAELVLLVNSDAVVMPEHGRDARAGAGWRSGGRRAAPRHRGAEARGPHRARHRGLGRHAFRRRGPAACGTSSPQTANGTRTPERIVDAVSGCVMLVHTDVFEAIGLLDEPYFFSVEDLDFCLQCAPGRILQRRDQCHDDASRGRQFHRGAIDDGACTMWRAIISGWHRAWRRCPPARACARGVSIVALNLAHAVTAQGGTMTSRVAAVLRGTRDHLRGRYGPAT